MSVRAEEPTGAEEPAVEQPDPGGRATRGRMSTWNLVFLAAGGVIGSGWMLSGTDLDGAVPGWWALGSWLIGAVLMAVVALVMVELSIRAPKTGGLIFLPLQAGGPLLATVVAAGLWAYYAVNPASESVAIVHNLAGLANRQGVSVFDNGILSILLATLFLALITAVNLVGPRRFLDVNRAVTVVKIFVPALIVVLLLIVLVFPPARPVGFPSSTYATPLWSFLRGRFAGRCLLLFPPAQTGVLSPVTPPGTSIWTAMLSSVVSGGVLYSYLGFQGPVDFAGNVRGGGIGEAWRLRLAVYGTLGGSMVLYLALQCVIIYLRHHSTGDVDASPSVYTAFVGAVVRPGWLAGLIKGFIYFDSLISPAGTALVFTFIMTREVAALSRAHLTHRGLQRSENSVVRPRHVLRFVRLVAGDDQLDVYKRILLVDFVVSLVVLVASGGNWSVLKDVSSILALLVYATPCVTLAALCRHRPARFPKPLEHVSAFSFAALAVVFVLSTGGVPRGIGALAIGCALLLGIPAVFPGARRYDARPHWREFTPFEEGDKAARLALVLGVYFAMLAIAETIRYRLPSNTPATWDFVGLGAVAAISLVAFYWMVELSAQYMERHPPLLPQPFPGQNDPAASGQAATAAGS
jgi:amino acid transporter